MKAIGTAPLSYRWLKNGVAVLGATGSLLTLNNVQSNDDGAYTVEVINGCGRTSSQTVALTMNAAGGGPQFFGGQPVTRGFTSSYVFTTARRPKDTAEPNFCGELGGASAWMALTNTLDGALVVTTDGSDFDTVLAIFAGPAQPDWNSIQLLACNNDSGPTVKTSWLSVRVQKGRHYFIALDGVNGAAGRTVLTYSYVFAPAFSEQPSSQTALLGSNVTFSAAASDQRDVGVRMPSMTYQWRKDGVNLAEGARILGVTTARLALSNLQLSDAGNYTLTVSNLVDSVTSAAATLTVASTQATGPPTDATPKITSWRLPPNREFELSFQSRKDQAYSLEASEDMLNWTVLNNLTATETTSSFKDVSARTHPWRFYRVKLGSARTTPTPTFSATVATMPVPGQIYPEGTKIGGSLFGVEFTIAPKWKGGQKPNTPALLFASDTEPGLVVAFLGFAGTKEAMLSDASLRKGIEMDTGAGTTSLFRPSNQANPLSAVGENRLSSEFEGQLPDNAGNPVPAFLGVEIVVHPSGGGMVFMGFTTVEKKTGMKASLQSFSDRVINTARVTNTEYMNYLNGRSFQWAGSGNDWYSNQPGIYSTSAGISSWGQNYAFFCGGGTFEINSTRETIASATSPTTGYSGISYSSTTKEYGQWTIIKSQQYGDLLLMVTLSGYQIVPVKIAADGSLFVGEHQLKPFGTFACTP